MSRVIAVVDKAIIIHLQDAVPGDVIYVRGQEDDPVIDEILVDGDKRKFVYKQRSRRGVKETVWMAPGENSNSLICIHDLKRERFEVEN